MISVRDTEVSHYTKVRRRVLQGPEVVRRRAHCPRILKPQPFKASLAPYPRSGWGLGTFPVSTSDSSTRHPVILRGQAGPTTLGATYLPSLLLRSDPSFLCSSHVGLVSIPPDESRWDKLLPFPRCLWFHPLEILSQLQHHLLKESCPKLVSPHNAISWHFTPFLHSTNCGCNDIDICVIISWCFFTH